MEQFKQRLAEVKARMEQGELDEIPLDARPKIPDFDYDKDSYVVISYSRKDFEQVYLFLAYLYREGYRFWYDNGMQGQDKWLNEFREKYRNPNCLGTVTFYSDSYISNATKEELSIIYGEDGYQKKNVMISLVALRDIDPDKVLKNAILGDRISIENAAAIKPLLSELIAAEKEKTIHRYAAEAEILPLLEKLGKVFSIRKTDTPVNANKDFLISDGVLFKYIGKDSHVVVPNSVTTIGEDAFRNCKSIVQISLPETVTTIQSGAFSQCDNLESICLPDHVTSLGNMAFYECRALKYISIPQGVTAIGDRGFAGCKGLERIDLPDSITEIGPYAFTCCENLREIHIPQGVCAIGQYAFRECRKLTEIAIPQGVTTIRESCFQCCSALKAVQLPQRLEKIEQNAFYRCVALEHIALPQLVEQIGDYAFYCCNALTQITLPDSVTHIGEGVFSACLKLETVTLSEKISTIANAAFESCLALCRVHLPAGIAHIGESAFRACDGLEHIDLPNGLISIGIEAFANCQFLHQVNLPKSIKEIEENAFDGSVSPIRFSYEGTMRQWERVKVWDITITKIACIDGILGWD